MKRFFAGSCAALLLLAASWAVAAERPQSLDLRRAVPADVFLVVHHQHNPERDYQRKYFEEVWETVQETQILERALKIATDRIPEEELEKAKSVLEELREAAAPIDVEAMLSCRELIYAQRMQFPTSHQFFLIRTTPEAAAAAEKGIANLFRLAEKYSGGELSVVTAQEGDAAITTLALPKEVPFRPTVVRIDDVLLISNDEEAARESLGMLLGGEGKSKFDDPRLKEALSHLPEPEDTLVFYDGKLQMSQLKEIGAFIREISGGDRDAARITGLLELVFDEVSILDYEITVEYTEENRNCTAAYGKLVPGYEDKVLAKVLGSGEPFGQWQTWVPDEAVSYSLSRGANLHHLYEGIVALINERIPEAQPGLEEFERLQAQFDVHLDRDILQAFSGECVSVSLPQATPSPLGGQDSVTALRCHKPERIRELLHRLIDLAQQNPFLKAQQLKLTECLELEGFEQLSLNMLAMLGARPVIGFRDGWMIIGSNASAVKTVLQTRAGEGQTIADTEAFKRFHLEVEGPVISIGYTDLAASIRNIAQYLNKAGLFAPMIIGLAGADSKSEALKPLQEVLALLPSVAKIVSKFDFLEAKISVTQDTDDPLCYLRRSVILVREEAEEDDTAQ